MSLYDYSYRNRLYFNSILYKLFPLFFFVFALVSCTDDSVSPSIPVELTDPIITSVSPDSAYINDDIVITGENFSTVTSANVVTFTGNVQGSIIAATSTSLVVTIPDGAQSGKISLSVLGKSCESISELFIPDTSDINIRAYIPLGSSTTVAVGDTLILYVEGSPDIAKITVRFGSAIAEILPQSVSLQTYVKLLIRVPAGASSGPITVKARGKTIETQSHVTVMTRLLPYKNCIIEITGLRVQVQNKTTITISGKQTKSETTYWKNFELTIDTRQLPILRPEWTSMEKGFIDNNYQLSYQQNEPAENRTSKNIIIEMNPASYAITGLSVINKDSPTQQGGHSYSSSQEEKTLVLSSLYQLGDSEYKYTLTGDDIRPFISQLLYSDVSMYSSPGSGSNSSSVTLVSYECPSTAKITIQFFD